MRLQHLCTTVLLISMGFAHAHIQEKLAIHREKINVIKNNITLNQPVAAHNKCNFVCKFRCKL